MKRTEKPNPRVFALTLDDIMEIVECVATNGLESLERDNYVKAWLFDHITKPKQGGGGV